MRGGKQKVIMSLLVKGLYQKAFSWPVWGYNCRQLRGLRKDGPKFRLILGLWIRTCRGGERSSMNELIEIAIGVLAEPMEGQWRVLIARRLPKKPLGGYWEFPGGKRQQGESPARCVEREFQEELGLNVKVTDALPAIDHRYDYGRVRLFPFFCERQGKEEPQALGVSEWRWVRPAELSDYPFPPANAALIDHVEYALRRSPEAWSGVANTQTSTGGIDRTGAKPEGNAEAKVESDTDSDQQAAPRR